MSPTNLYDFTKPYFNTQTAAAYVDSPSPEAFRKWLRRHGVPTGRYGRNLRVTRADLDRALGMAHRNLRSA
ncbi:MAG: hypothetical protein ABI665_09410 [Vicinamibacterales bacterium]